MSDESRNEPLNEPIAIPDLYVTGIALEVSHGAVRLIGWTSIAPTADEPPERRIVVRLSMANETARAFATKLRAELAMGGH